MKRLVSKIILIILSMLIISGISYAQSQAEDSCLLTVQPPTNFSIRIDTPSATLGIDFGNITLNEVKYNTLITTVTNDGSVVSDWRIKITQLNTWMVNDSNTDRNSVGVDTVTLCAVLTSSTTVVPTDDTYFDTVGDCYDLLKTSLQNMTTDYYCYGTDGNGNTVDGDDVPANASYRLHTRMKGPSSTTDIGQQQFRLTIEVWSDHF